MISSLPKLDPLDRRLNLYRSDVANIALKGRVQSEKFIEGRLAQITVAFSDMRSTQGRECGLDTQLLFGEHVRVFETRDGQHWVQNVSDDYVGWLDADVVSFEVIHPTHLVCAQRTFLYPEPDMKLPHKGMRSMGSRLTIVGEIEDRGTQYSVLASGEAVITRHIRKIDEHDKDYVAVAESLINAPYLWAGTTAFGLDCSGLVKLAMFMSGHNVLRDSDMQAATVGAEIDMGTDYQNLRRGDLVFWRGHVGICQSDNDQGAGLLLHANGHSMNVASEPLHEAINRITYLYEKPIGARRV